MVCLENLPVGGPSGNQTFLWGCAPQESLREAVPSQISDMGEKHSSPSTLIFPAIKGYLGIRYSHIPLEKL